MFEQEPVAPDNPLLDDGQRARHAARAVLDRRVLRRDRARGPRLHRRLRQRPHAEVGDTTGLTREAASAPAACDADPADAASGKGRPRSDGSSSRPTVRRSQSPLEGEDLWRAMLGGVATGALAPMTRRLDHIHVRSRGRQRGGYAKASRDHRMLFFVRSKNGAKTERSATRPLSTMGP